MMCKARPCDKAPLGRSVHGKGWRRRKTGKSWITFTFAYLASSSSLFPELTILTHFSPAFFTHSLTPLLLGTHTTQTIFILTQSPHTISYAFLTRIPHTIFSYNFVRILTQSLLTAIQSNPITQNKVSYSPAGAKGSRGPVDCAKGSRYSLANGSRGP